MGPKEESIRERESPGKEEERSPGAIEEIIQDSKKRSAEYVRNWEVPGGGE